MLEGVGGGSFGFVLRRGWTHMLGFGRTSAQRAPILTKRGMCEMGAAMSNPKTMGTRSRRRAGVDTRRAPKTPETPPS